MSIISLYAEVDRIYSQTLGAGIQSLAITSCHSGEGVSTVAMALAERSLIAGNRTLYVDLNTYRPRLARCIGDLNVGKQAAIYQPSISQLDGGTNVVMGVEAPKRREELLKFREAGFLSSLNQEWLKQFDKIVIDTVPLSLSNISNIPAESVARECESTLVVALAGQTKQDELQRSLDLVKRSGGELVGVVLNDRDNPSLSSEIEREINRLARICPKLKDALLRYVSQWKGSLVNCY